MDIADLTLVLVRHGQYVDTIPGGELTSLGIRDVERMAEFISSIGFHPNHIWQSGKKRAEQTAMILSSQFDNMKVEVRDDIAPGSDYYQLANELRSLTGQIMVVSHLPFLERLTGEILFKIPEQEIIQFYPGSMLCLQR